ncbi:MAG: TIGR04197 family type VII secretion effector [Lachnospiraceae bacterium]|nr:TIGR04197 family type VII secretion effector [Lachnospiraceae bacterium]
MSGTGTFKSSEAEAQNHSMALQVAAAGMATMLMPFQGVTNLTVMTNMNHASFRLESCNTNFKELVNSDAESILDLKDAFDEFDTNLASYMGGE